MLAISSPIPNTKRNHLWFPLLTILYATIFTYQISNRLVYHLPPSLFYGLKKKGNIDWFVMMNRCTDVMHKTPNTKKQPLTDKRSFPESKVRGTNMDPGGPQVGPMNFAIWVGLTVTSSSGKQTFSFSVVANRMNWQIPQCTCHLSHNAPPRTEMCTFLFWMVHYEIRKRCFWGFVN